MPSKRGNYGSGTIDPSGKNSWRLRYRIGGRRYTKVVSGTKTDAAKELRRLLHDGDIGAHIAPDKIRWLNGLPTGWSSRSGRSRRAHLSVIRKCSPSMSCR